VRFYERHSHGLGRALVLPYRAGSFLRLAARSARAGRPELAAAYARGLAHGLADLCFNTELDSELHTEKDLEWATRTFSAKPS
jgi:hypothetical protein